MSLPNHSGAGIGGLTCAVALSKYSDIEVNVYEAATRFGEVGAGLGLFPRELNAMIGFSQSNLAQSRRPVEDHSKAGSRRRSAQSNIRQTQGGPRYSAYVFPCVRRGLMRLWKLRCSDIARGIRPWVLHSIPSKGVSLDHFIQVI